MPSPNPENVKRASREYENGRADGRRRAYEEIQREVFGLACLVKGKEAQRAMDAVSRKLVRRLNELRGGE